MSEHKTAIVTDHRMLRGMEIKGFIIRNGGPKSSEKHWTGLQVKILHVTKGPRLENWYDVFSYRGTDYRLRYFDGCFKPFVTRLDAGLSLPQFV